SSIRIGCSPARASASVARTPAGPAPTMTTLCVKLSYSRARAGPEFGEHVHAFFHQRIAGPDPAAVRQSDPAVLTCAHQAKSGAAAIAELERANVSLVQQHGSQQQVPAVRVCRLPVDRELHDGRTR